MLMKAFERLPEEFKCDEVRPYYDILKKKGFSLFLKRVFDIIVAVVLIILLAFPMLIICIAIKVSSKGSVIYKQERVTTLGKRFMILKFRSMRTDADKTGALVTCDEDDRVTPIGKFMRRFRLDELPQLFNVLSGSMTIVGTRPEVPKYVDAYTPEMMATLLLPAGVTSPASIKFKDEAELLKKSSDIDKQYIEVILPQKMEYNLQYISDFGFGRDISIILKTVVEVFK